MGMDAIPGSWRWFGGCVVLAGLILCPGRLCADAWTQPPAHGQVILNLSLMSLSEGFDGSGKVKPFGDGGRFRKIEFNPYIEYGWNGRTTLIVNTFLPALKYSNRYGVHQSFGLGNVETGVRRRLNSPDSPAAVSLQFTVQFPAYTLARDPLSGNHQLDVEARFLVGRGFAIGRRHSFLSASAAHRSRNGPPADQFRSDGSWGVDLDRRLMLLAQYSGITGLRNGSPFTVTTNPNLHSDFDLYKGQVSLVARVARGMRVQFGWVHVFDGRNTGRGNSVLAAIWQEF
jgi:hypothetical protein